MSTADAPNPDVTNKVEVGFFSFTEVLDGRHREYNEWHLLDHLPENLALPGLQWGQRWVSTPELVERRLMSREEVDATRYVTLYLFTPPVRPALEGFLALGRELHAAGRFFDARRSHLSGPFALVKAYANPRVLVDAAAIPYRPHQGLFVTVQDHAEGSSDAALAEVREWYDRIHVPDLLGVHGVAGCWWFEAMPDAPTGPTAAVNPPGRTIRVYWLDEDPVAFHDDLAAKTPDMEMIDVRAAYRTLLVGAYRSIPWPSAFDWFDEPA